MGMVSEMVSFKGRVKIKTLIEWSEIIGIALFVIALIVLSIMPSMSYGEMVKEWHDGVLYIYNRDSEPVVRKPIGEAKPPSLLSEETDKAEQVPTFLTEEDEILNDIAKARERGSLYSVIYLFEAAGRYDEMIIAAQEQIRQTLNEIELAPDKCRVFYELAELYEQIGDKINFEKASRAEAECLINQSNHTSAMITYKKLFDTEKVKEMYRLQQQKVRNTPYKP